MFPHIPIALLIFLVTIIATLIESTIIDKSINIYLKLIPVGLLIAFVTTGVGLFEANAIQFGLDQLLEAPTPKLIAFIHWFYWTHNAVQLVATYLKIGSIIIERYTKLFPRYYRTCNKRQCYTIATSSRT